MYVLKVANQINAEYWPVSSKTGENINELFHRIAALTFDGFIKDGNNLNRQIQIGTSLIKRIGKYILTVLDNLKFVFQFFSLRGNKK